MIGIELTELHGLLETLDLGDSVSWGKMVFEWNTNGDEVCVFGKAVDDDYPVMLPSLVTYFAAMLHQGLTDEEPATIDLKYSFTPETREFVVRAVVK